MIQCEGLFWDECPAPSHIFLTAAQVQTARTFARVWELQ
jgi:hypothetical protein